MPRVGRRVRVHHDVAPHARAGDAVERDADADEVRDVREHELQPGTLLGQD
jgi:hypothetical protein